MHNFRKTNTRPYLDSLKKIGVGLCLLFIFSCGGTKNYDLLILNGTVYDGSGNTPIMADIAIKDSMIVMIGNLDDAIATQTIDAQGLAVAPGFIDMHTHLEPIMELSSCESHVRQGVTTALGGPDGGSPWPLGSFMDSLEAKGIGMNVAYLVGHNTIRRNIMGLENRTPTPTEQRAMEAQVDSAMQAGAYGISTGLKYLPGTFSNVEEVIALSKVASKYGGIYTSHLREEGLGLFDAVAEAIQISEQADIPVVLTHHKAIGKPMWGKSSRTLSMVDSARARGLDIKMDQYPYTASYTGISVIIPSWSMAGGLEAFEKRVSDPILRDSIRNGIVFNILNDRGGSDLNRIQFAKVEWQPELEGKTLKYWVEQKGLEPTVENGAELVIEAQLNGGAACVFHAMAEEDVTRIMQHPQTMIGSDGRLVEPGMGHPHPRWYGTFSRVLGHYVREKKTLSLQEAIRKMTLLPAQTLGLTDRGQIKENMKADMVIFNPETVIDKATFEKPHQYPEGIPFVIVNGNLTVDNGTFVDARSGKVLRKQ
ncbi:amidohydrolase family protein [Flagellimonas olearia]|uniref:Amidohydrolase family protein n=1 Tax=Flagellimonas olearia TaxID=552546 RepID=A0A6I1E1X7_9FLAO|nr:D-aminoacylase [Allomuricauda olearia]KAB7530449.1 amidohydrolase family protein [Allomuricauda olearia]